MSDCSREGGEGSKVGVCVDGVGVAGGEGVGEIGGGSEEGTLAWGGEGVTGIGEEDGKTESGSVSSEVVENGVSLDFPFALRAILDLSYLNFFPQFS